MIGRSWAGLRGFDSPPRRGYDGIVQRTIHSGCHPRDWGSTPHAVNYVYRISDHKYFPNILPNHSFIGSNNATLTLQRCWSARVCDGDADLLQLHQAAPGDRWIDPGTDGEYPD